MPARIASLLRTLANRQVTKRLEAASTQLNGLAETILDISNEVEKRQSNDTISKFAESIVTRLEHASAYLKGAELDSLLTDIRTYSEDNPASAAIAAAAVAYGLTRLVKVSASKELL